MYGDKIEIMAGSGINPGNVKDIISFTGVQAVHFSSSYNYCKVESFEVIGKGS